LFYLDELSMRLIKIIPSFNWQICFDLNILTDHSWQVMFWSQPSYWHLTDHSKFELTNHTFWSLLPNWQLTEVSKLYLTNYFLISISLLNTDRWFQIFTDKSIALILTSLLTTERSVIPNVIWQVTFRSLYLHWQLTEDFNY